MIKWITDEALGMGRMVYDFVHTIVVF